MIKLAILYKSILLSQFYNCIFNEKYKYYFIDDLGFPNFDILFQSNLNENLSFVSVDSKDNVIGLISLSIKKDCNYVHNLSLIRFNFDVKYDFVFAKDVKSVFDKIFYDFSYHKLNFSSCVFSPHIDMFEKFIDIYGGNRVGIYSKHCRLLSGELCDVVVYELTKEQYIKRFL